MAHSAGHRAQAGPHASAFAAAPISDKDNGNGSGKKRANLSVWPYAHSGIPAEFTVPSYESLKLLQARFRIHYQLTIYHQITQKYQLMTTCLPAQDELSMCRTILVSSEQPVLCTH